MGFEPAPDLRLKEGNTDAPGDGSEQGCMGTCAGTHRVDSPQY